MKAIVVEPHKPATARLEHISEPDEREGSVLVEAVAVGVCGTDIEIVDGKYGSAPPGKAQLVLGHESLGRVLDPGPNGSLQRGDLVVGIVRRPDPVPCSNCAVGEWDMCRNGQYTERGIKELDGFMSERWRIEPEYVMKIDRSLGLLGVLVDWLHEAMAKANAAIINAGAYAHSSIALRDAVAAVPIPVIEVHLSNIYAREGFRRQSMIAQVARGSIVGFGPLSYMLALDAASHLCKGASATQAKSQIQ